MSEPPVLVCPECGAPRAADGTPSCTCAHRAAEAHLESRTAEAAAAEDFDPVRIRPFVEVGEEPVDPADEPEQPSTTGDLPTAGDVVSPAPVEEPAVQSPADGEPGRPGRRTVLLAGAGAAVAVLVTGGFVGGLFSYDGPARDGSVAGGVRAGVPEQSPQSSGPSAISPSTTATSTEASASPSSSPSADPSGSATPSGPPTPTPTLAPSSAAATSTVAPRPTVSNGQPPVLRYGDQGAEVVELQLRLKQVGLYDGEADGDFSRAVESAVRTYQVTRFVLQDDSGVYGTETRASLESETTEP
ncbi:peptidoglycan-binding domain-containing protein [Streptomyces griseorubiginosus]|uniref:peptidoglycan-binding domain-containing protein n=1 Tax=Streptomyces griseorubiginosus TaxID=67304 RepID=UPI002E822122|nr:peptidoglycan-binding domain-containing protein [Streptomyces griseorubiginosus]WUB42187.1 peptidoglycan-binding protein [Streptomyces griseorubiginosus]WUB50706.1 peptidoglycan-binding protein [Streptomyces griseorubiginosus]